MKYWAADKRSLASRIRLPSAFSPDINSLVFQQRRISTPASLEPLSEILRHLKEIARQIVDRDSAGSISHDPEGHRCPSDMDRPAIGHGEFDDRRQEQEPERPKAGAQANDQQNHDEAF